MVFDTTKACGYSGPKSIQVFIFILVIVSVEPNYEGFMFLFMTLYHFYRSPYGYDSLIGNTLALIFPPRKRKNFLTKDN